MASRGFTRRGLRRLPVTCDTRVTSGAGSGAAIYDGRVSVKVSSGSGDACRFRFRFGLRVTRARLIRFARLKTESRESKASKRQTQTQRQVALAATRAQLSASLGALLLGRSLARSGRPRPRPKLARPGERAERFSSARLGSAQLSWRCARLSARDRRHRELIGAV